MQEISQEKIQFLRERKNFIKPILQMLQDNGGELSGYSQLDKLIPQYAEITDEDINFHIMSDKGNKYTPYHFGRNFAVKELEVAGFLTHQKNGTIILTQKGLDADISTFDTEKDVLQVTRPYWNERDKKNRNHEQQNNAGTNDNTEDFERNTYHDNQEWREEILNKVKSLEWDKFESFCRGLFAKMGFEIDSIKGIKKSGDGGIDGFGYCLDKQSLKTTRVAVQCKKYTDNPVGSPEINNLRGAIDTHRAEYGVFITTSYFSNDAIRISREGGTPITLIDGNELVDLMVKYKYKVREVPLYVPDETYFEL